MQCFPQNSSCFFSLCIANCIPVCHHAKKFCAVDDKNSVVLCELFYRLQRDGSAQVGLLGLRTRMCYKNTQFILIIRFEIMIPLNIHKSPLSGHINMRFFLNYNCLLSPTLSKATSPLQNIFQDTYVARHLASWAQCLRCKHHHSRATWTSRGLGEATVSRSWRREALGASSQGQRRPSPTLSNGGREPCPAGNLRRTSEGRLSLGGFCLHSSCSHEQGLSVSFISKPPVQHLVRKISWSLRSTWEPRFFITDGKADLS